MRIYIYIYMYIVYNVSVQCIQQAVCVVNLRDRLRAGSANEQTKNLDQTCHIIPPSQIDGGCVWLFLQVQKGNIYFTDRHGWKDIIWQRRGFQRVWLAQILNFKAWNSLGISQEFRGSVSGTPDSDQKILRPIRKATIRKQRIPDSAYLVHTWHQPFYYYYYYYYYYYS